MRKKLSEIVFVCEIISLFKYVFATLFLAFTYIYLSRLWTPLGGGSSQLFKIEVKIIVLILLLLYFPQIKNKVVKYIYPVLVILIPYSLFDIFYNFLGRAPRISDFQNYATLFDFSPFLSVGFFLYLFFLFFIFLYLFYVAYKKLSTRRKWADLAVRVIVSAIFVFGVKSNYFAEIITDNFKYIEWSQQRTISKNGRFSSFVYFCIDENKNINLLNKYKNQKIDFYKEIFPGNISRKRNIHIVVLESFIDPRNIEGVTFSKSPVAEELKKYLKESINNFSHVFSPVYGGGTSQSEFELFTGVKALAKIKSIEFNVLGGNPSFSFINRLKKNHYSTIATIASNSGYYNSKQAYRSLGFTDVSFMEESADYKMKKDDDRIFDGDAFNVPIGEWEKIPRL